MVLVVIDKDEKYLVISNEEQSVNNDKGLSIE